MSVAVSVDLSFFEVMAAVAFESRDISPIPPSGRPFNPAAAPSSSARSVLKSSGTPPDRAMANPPRFDPSDYGPPEKKRAATARTSVDKPVAVPTTPAAVAVTTNHSNSVRVPRESNQRPASASLTSCKPSDPLAMVYQDHCDLMASLRDAEREDDGSTVQRLGSLSQGQLLDQVKDVFNWSHRLSVDEARELQRGRSLGIPCLLDIDGERSFAAGSAPF